MSRIKEVGTIVNTRNYCAVCDRTGSRAASDGRCDNCGQGKIFARLCDYLTTAERVERTLPIRLTNDNEGRTRHFSVSRKRRLAYENDLRIFGFFRTKPPLFKQKVTLTRLLGPGEKFWDWDSVLRGSAKELVDALAALKFFLTDGPRWVVGVAGLQDDTGRRRYGPGVRILIEKVSD